MMTPRDRAGGEQYCALFAGVSGKAVVVTLTALAFASYVAIFARRSRRGDDVRSWRIFWLDLSGGRSAHDAARSAAQRGSRAAAAARALCTARANKRIRHHATM